MRLKYIFICLAVVCLASCSQNQQEKEISSYEKFTINRGVNVSHWLSQTKKRGAEREAYVSAVDFKKIAEMGFDHVRIPFDEEQMWDKQGKRNEEAFKLLHNAINWSFENNLNVIVDLHIIRSHYFNATDNTLWTDTLAQQQFFDFWEQLSNEFIKYPLNKLAYELMNEAVADDSDDWNNLISKGIEVVREKEPGRVIVVGSNRWQQVDTFSELKIPENDTNLILSFHFYEPFILSHYRTSWSGLLQEYKGEVSYPGYTVDTNIYSSLSDTLVKRLRADNHNYSLEFIEERIMKAVKVARKFDLPLYCGEFGCYPSTKIEIRSTYYKDLVTVFNKYNIAWAHWNYKNDFPLVDSISLEPITELTSVLLK